MPLEPPVTEPSKPIGKTADDINDLFKELDSEPIPETKEAKKDRKEDKDDQPEIKEDEEGDDEDELELKDPDEEVEKLDLEEQDNLEIDAPPRKKEILKAYPDLFKKFPFLEKMMYRDKIMNGLFGSFDDAKEVHERNESWKNFESQLMEGNTEQLLREVKDSDQRAFDIIVDDYLPTLAKVDKEAYIHVVSNLNKRLIMEMIQEAKDSGNDDLKEAALLVNQFVFGNSKFTPPSLRVDKKEDPKNSEAEKERLSFLKERFETVRDDLQSQVDNTLRATISEYIDPRGTMSPYVKKNAVADAMKYINEAIGGDSATVKNLDKLWRAAFENKFSKNDQDKIKSFYLSRAKSNLKAAILKARSEALKDAPPSKSRETDDEPEERSSPQRRISTGRPPTPSKGRNEMRKGESVQDFFARD